MSMFRFQDLEVWRKAIEIGDRLLDIADALESQKLFRFADQLRGAALSISNNVAEGSGSASNRDFAHFLNIAKRFAFENANMLLVFHRRNLVTDEQVKAILSELEQECRMLEALRRKLGDK